MKAKPTILRIALAVTALLAVQAVRATESDDGSDRSGTVRVDVVVDMTEAGHKIIHPTPEQPAYYLPLSVGYKTFGFTRDFQRPPSNEWDIQHALAIALYNQGYRLMTKQGHPSLVLVFWWGYMAPEEDDVAYNVGSAVKPNSIPFAAQWGAGQPLSEQPPGYFMTTGNKDGSENVLPPFSFGSQNIDEQQMLSMVAGNTIDDHQKYPDPRLDDVIQMTTAGRYYIMVSAFDFESWLHHKPVLLWRAHVSTELWGHYFDQVVGTLIAAAGPQFGRETKVPHFTSEPLTPLGKVIIGTPVVKDYPAAPPAK